MGAGPAGAAAAIVLARAGVDVVMLDRARFPREKVCGDGLIPDAFAALTRLGVIDQVRAEACTLAGARFVAPGGADVDVAFDVLTLPRRRLDQLLVEAARSAGARALEGVTVEGPLERSGRVVGVRGHGTGHTGALEIESRVTILATGAASRILETFRVLRWRRPHALALRGYFRTMNAGLESIIFSYERRLLPGYAWVFPVGDGVANVGVIRFLGRRGARRVNLQDDLRRFLSESPVARQLLAVAEPLGPAKGAPVRTGLRGSRWWRPGLLLAGEAVGASYAASGEGIGKALETGCEAGRVALEALAAETPAEIDRILADYPGRIRERCGDIHRAYRVAERWVRFPQVVDLVARRANADRRVREALEAVVREQAEASRVVSFPNLVRLALAPIFASADRAASRGASAA